MPIFPLLQGVTSPAIAIPSAVQGVGADAQATDAAQTLSSLRLQAQEISQRLQHEAKVRQALSDRLGTASPNHFAVLNGQLARVDADIAGLVASLADANGRIAALQGSPGTGTIAPPIFPPREHIIDPDAITAVFVMFSIAVIVPLSVGLTRKLWRRAPKEVAASQTENVSAARLDRLEQAVDAIAIEIERISEGQRFVTKMLAERTIPARASNTADASDAGPLGEGKPFLALGAGPIEPIPVVQRQTVRPSITPH